MPEGRTAACSSRCRAERSRRLRVAAVREGLLTLKAQIEDLVDKVNRLDGTHTRSRGP
jgi:hypothetical protein